MSNFKILSPQETINELSNLDEDGDDLIGEKIEQERIDNARDTIEDLNDNWFPND